LEVGSMSLCAGCEMTEGTRHGVLTQCQKGDQGCLMYVHLIRLLESWRMHVDFLRAILGTS